MLSQLLALEQALDARVWASPELLDCTSAETIEVGYDPCVQLSELSLILI